MRDDKKKVFITLFIIAIIFFKPCCTLTAETMQHGGVIVQFEDPLGNVAEDIERIYPVVKDELENALRWKLDFVPTVVLMNDRKTFQTMTGNIFAVAVALPQNNLIVIDNSRMNIHPFTLEITLKHELCHLMLHNSIKGGNLPRWLDEGIAQWVSGGISEIITGGGKRALKEAALSDRLISLNELEDKFPEDEKSLTLAYEESRSFVEYINREFGANVLLQILSHLKDGSKVDMAIQKVLFISLKELEERWHMNLRKRITWVVYVSDNIYIILFFLAALITAYGFVRVLIKQRAYRDDEEEQDITDRGAP